MSLAEATKLLDAAILLSTGSRFSLDDYCFDKQLQFINDPAPFKTAVCSRRAGKTVACATHLVYAASNKAKVVCLYITLSRSNGKKIIWPELCELNRRFNLLGKVNESELSIKFPNGSVIYISGAKDSKEIEKFRGLPLYLCYIDECQSFRPYISNLVDEVISKALFDHNGTLCLTGTPGPVPLGFFYDCSKSKEWSHHAWTMHSNPWLQIKSGKTPDELIKRELVRKGVGLDDPTIQRECFGQWVTDKSALVFKYDSSKNHFDSSHWPIPTIGTWRYIMGVDVGYDDADACCILGYNDKLKSVYLVEERVKTKQGVTALAKDIIDLHAKYKTDIIVMDTGGLGKKIAEEITSRYAIIIEPAEKVRKFEFIELLNDAMRTERFYADKCSRFAQDSSILEWDRDPEYKGEKPRMRDNFHSDITDSVLYAFRESFHWLYEPETPKIVPGTKEWIEKQEKEMEEAALLEINRNKKDPWEDPIEKVGADDWD